MNLRPQENAAVEIPGLDELRRMSSRIGITASRVAVPMFGGKLCRIVLEGYDEDDRADDFRIAIAGTLAARLTRSELVVTRRR